MGSVKPEIKSFTPPSITNGLNFDTIIAKWSEFLEQVNSEKFSLGSLLANAKLIDLDGSTINLEVEQSDDCKIIDDNKSYFSKKTQEIFGKKLEFHFTNGKENPAKEISKKQSVKQNPPSSRREDNSSKNSDIIDAIINKLGGQEIK